MHAQYESYCKEYGLMSLALDYGGTDPSRSKPSIFELDIICGSMLLPNQVAVCVFLDEQYAISDIFIQQLCLKGLQPRLDRTHHNFRT